MKLKGIRVKTHPDGQVTVTPLYHAKARGTMALPALAVKTKEVKSAMEGLLSVLTMRGDLGQ